MATFVLVPGGGRGAWTWAKVVPALEGAGHKVYTLSLTGVGELAHLLTPDTNLSTHIGDIVDLLERENLRDVILVANSYGAIPLMGAADRALDLIKELVIIKGAHARDGESLGDTVPGLAKHFASEKQNINGVDVVMIPRRQNAAHIGGDDPETLDWMMANLTPHPYACTAEPLALRNEAAVLKIPRTAIDSKSVLAGRDGKFIERVRSAHRVFEVDADHDVLFTAPAQVAEILLSVAS